MIRRLLFAAMVWASLGNSWAGPAASISRSTQQCIVVLADSWSSTHGTLWRFERKRGSRWSKVGGGTPVVLGRKGLAWGRGEIAAHSLPGPVKREGDDKAPAGVFRLGTAFGYAATPVPTRLRYVPLTNNVVAVDDPESSHYNQLVDKTKVGSADWRSAENMILNDQRYRWGIWVEHNDPPVPGAGSCIFLHIWKSSSTLTSGCTAMPESAMVRLLGWLDPAKEPRLIQLPRPIYNELKVQWKLPELY